MKIHLDTFGTKLAENNQRKCSRKTEIIKRSRECFCVDFRPQEPRSGDWAKVAVQGAKAGRYMSEAAMAALNPARMFLVLAGQATITRGQEIPCEFNVRSPLLECLVLHQEEEAHMLGARFPLLQASSSTCRSQAVALQFCIFPSLLWSCLTLTITVCCRIPCSVSASGGNLGPPSIPYHLASGLRMVQNTAFSVTVSPPAVPSPERTGTFCQASINHQPNASHLLTLPWLFPSPVYSKWNLPFLRRPCVPCSPLKQELFLLPDPSYHWV